MSKRVTHTARFEWHIDKAFTDYIVNVFCHNYCIDIGIYKHEAGTDIKLEAFSLDILLEGVGAFYVHMTLYYTRQWEKEPEKKQEPMVKQEEFVCQAEQLLSQARYIFEHHQEKQQLE